MSDREKANEMLMAKELKNLQFENPGTNQVLAEYGSIGTSRRKRAVRQKNEQRTERKDPYHDEKGKLVVNGERFTLCDCLRAACSGCHWPCPRCV
ncbi:unnamed protein product, partial [Mesorhabditis belari]|uniref:ARF7 effector protein C-terminal domain-containing protein n=1 Tax=Mesorhabditis belari TaxID=2138241 RepID=A0AAF3EP97_9BILA